MSKFKMGDVIKVVNDEAKISEGDGLIVDIDGEYYIVKWPSCELTGKHLQKYIDHHYQRPQALAIDADDCQDISSFIPCSDNLPLN